MRKRTLILGGLLLAVAELLVLLLSRGDGQVALKDHEPGISAIDASTASSAVEHEGPPRRNSQPAVSTRTSVAESSSVAAAPKPVISFHYEGGQSAVGLQLYRADSKSAMYERAMQRALPTWTHRLGANGELDAENAATLGSLVAVRASDVAVELVPFDPEKTRSYELTPIVDQEFLLVDAPSGRESTAEIDIGSADFRKFGSDIDYHTERIEGLSDHVTLVATHPDHLVVAYARLQLKSPGPSVHLMLPRGEYWVDCMHCTVGAWMRQEKVIVDGTPIRLPLVAVPVTQVILKRGADGRALVPEHVRVYFDTRSHDGTSGGGGEIEMDREVLDDHLVVGERWRDTEADGRYTKYALKFYWRDGTTSITPLGEWESLLETVDLGGR